MGQIALENGIQSNVIKNAENQHYNIVFSLINKQC